MKKLFTFLFAALLSVSMFGATVTEDISMNASDWGWGYNSQVVVDGNMLKCTLTGEWGAMATGWNEPTRDLSEWDKIVIVVENMNGCDGEWFKLKAYLRDYVNRDSEQGQMEATLGLDAEDRQQNYMVINLKEEGKNVNLTACGVLGIQCQPNGAEFKISRVYLEKEVPETNVEVFVFDAPAEWQTDGTGLTAEDFPGFVPVTENFAKSMAVPQQGTVYLFYGFDSSNQGQYVKFQDGVYQRTSFGLMTRNAIYNTIAAGLKVCYPVAVEDELPQAPETAPAVPDHAEEDVMALYCSHYTTNNLHFQVLNWGDSHWNELTLGEDSTKVYACTDMTWDMMTNWDADSYDLSAYKKFHCDLWVPFAAVMKVTFEAQSGWKNGVTFNLNEGWNTIDCDPAWWTDSLAYDWTDVKYIAFEGYAMADGETSAEGNPFAFTNLYWWNPAAPASLPAEAPAAPKLAEKDVQALFCSAYKNRTFNFAPTSWGTQWIDHEYGDGTHIWYADAMAWDGFTNWDTTRYDLNAYDMMHADIYVTLDSKLKITFEALAAAEGGSGWKNGASFDLVGNQWNSLDIDLLNAPYDSYDFKDLRYMILEGFVKPDGSSAEGTPLAVANVYFWNSMTPVENVAADQVAVKRIVNGQLIIQVNGEQYNVLGTQF